MSVAASQDSTALEHLELINSEGKIDFSSMEQLVGFQEKFLSIVLIASNRNLLKNDFNQARLYGYVWAYVSGLSLYLGYKSESEFSSLLYALVVEKLNCSLTYDEAFTITAALSETEEYQQGMNQGSEDVSKLANFVLENNDLESYQELTLDTLHQSVPDFYKEQEPLETEFNTKGVLNDSYGPIAECVAKCLDCLILSLTYAKIDVLSLTDEESQYTFGYIAGACDAVIKTSGEEVQERSAVVITTQVLASLFGEDKSHDLFETLITTLREGLPLSMTGYTRGERDALASFDSYPPLELTNFFLKQRQ